MEAILQELTKIRGTQAAAIIGRDGLLIQSEGDPGVDADFLAASFADMCSTLENHLSDKLKQGNPQYFEVETPLSRWFIIGLNDMNFLVIKSELQINLGLLRQEIKNARMKLLDIL